MNLIDLRNTYISQIKSINYSNIFIKENTFVFSPLRINFSAGWNDTPPYCNEVKGFTLNSAILLNNDFPIRVFIKRIPSFEIILTNLDNTTSISIKNMDELLNCQSSDANFALLKASILASGLFPFNKVFNLYTFFKNFAGFEISFSASNIPVGSGLGTSSAIIYSCIKAIYKYISLSILEKDLFHMTAIAEQIMNTGGGYQDQIGVYSKGIKFISFSPGTLPNINCEVLSLENNFTNILKSRLVFIFTGKTRVAKHILHNIMNNYLEKDLSTLTILNYIGNIAIEMKENLLDKDLLALGHNMSKSFKLTQKLNSNFSNQIIDKLIFLLENYIDGYMLSGSGNGGFLTILLKENVTRNTIANLLKQEKYNDFQVYNFDLFL